MHHNRTLNTKSMHLYTKSISEEYPQNYRTNLFLKMDVKIADARKSV